MVINPVAVKYVVADVHQNDFPDNQAMLVGTLA
jgi:hypothetical protein